jgi:carbon-monoxide dehydrogenase large subunit
MTSISGVRHGSTSHVEEGFGSFHSRAVVMGGSAIVIAAEKLKATICDAAAQVHNCSAKDVRFVDGEIVLPDGGKLPLRDVAEHALTAMGTFTNNKNTYAYGAHAAHVAVDPETGRVEVIDYLAVEDVGGRSAIRRK